MNHEPTLTGGQVPRPSVRETSESSVWLLRLGEDDLWRCRVAGRWLHRGRRSSAARLGPGLGHDHAGAWLGLRAGCRLCLEAGFWRELRVAERAAWKRRLLQQLLQLLQLFGLVGSDREPGVARLPVTTRTAPGETEAGCLAGSR